MAENFTLTNSTYLPPSPKLLHENAPAHDLTSRAEIDEDWKAIAEVLASANTLATVTSSVTGPQATRFELRLGPGVPLEALAALQPQFAERLKNRGPIRMLLPIPGRDRAGIEVPNCQRRFWASGELFGQNAWQRTDAALPLMLGRDLLNKTTVIDLSKAPHLLLAGDAGTGKTMCLCQFMASLILHFRPDELRLMLFDSRATDFRPFAALPHLIVPPVSSVAPGLVMLEWVGEEMRRRQQTLANDSVHTFEDYNRKNPNAQLPWLVVILDEFTPMLQGKRRERTTAAIQRLVSAGAVGIHLIASTQFPYPENLSDELKNCFPWRIAFRTLQASTSKLILDEAGAETLIGKGDMLFKGPDFTQRYQCGSITEEECRELTRACSKQQAADPDMNLQNNMAAAELAERNAAAAAKAAREAPPLPFKEAPASPAATTAAPSAPAAQPEASPAPAAEPSAMDALRAILKAGKATVEVVEGALGISAERATNLLDELSAHEYLGPVTDAPDGRPIFRENLPAEFRGSAAATRKTLESLLEELSAKIASNDPNSKTVAEFNKGIHAIGKKIVEEAAEVWMASEYEGPERTAEEISQLFYHLLVMMIKKKISLEDLYKLL